MFSDRAKDERVSHHSNEHRSNDGRQQANGDRSSAASSQINNAKSMRHALISATKSSAPDERRHHSASPMKDCAVVNKIATPGKMGEKRHSSDMELDDVEVCFRK
jgi:hypothetical protein